mmetsp:Transcript_22618/g.51040  ORF Transcript_22618/g.51040 Transcript_22618/m.51040 type:complete len:97 (+) Transcript_22618:65-355(+)
MDKCGQEVERIARHVPLLRREVMSLRQELINVHAWHEQNPKLPHPAAPGGPMSWEHLLARFSNLEREMRMLNEKVADARSSQVTGSSKHQILSNRQ